MSKPDLTQTLTNNNIASVRKQIFLKQGCKPYYGTVNDAQTVLTDMDHFPYKRFYHGVYNSSDPVVFEREAGWRGVNNSCYQARKCDQPVLYPNHCWESACSVVYPCYPQYLAKYADQEALDVMLNNACIVQYR